VHYDYNDMIRTSEPFYHGCEAAAWAN